MLNTESLELQRMQTSGLFLYCVSIYREHLFFAQPPQTLQFKCIVHSSAPPVILRQRRNRAHILNSKHKLQTMNPVLFLYSLFSSFFISRQFCSDFFPCEISTFVRAWHPFIEHYCIISNRFVAYHCKQFSHHVSFPQVCGERFCFAWIL